MDEPLHLHGGGKRSSRQARENLAGGLHAALRPASLLDQKRTGAPRQLPGHPHLLHEHEAPAGDLGSVADVQVFRQGVELPTSGLFQRPAPPQPGGPVEVEEAAAPVPPALLEEEVPVQKNGLGAGQPRVALVQVVPPRLHHSHARVRHDGEEPLEQVGFGNEVGVEDQHELARRALQARSQGTRLEALATGPSQHRHVHPSPAPEAGAPLRQNRGLVGGVVENLDLKAVPRMRKPARRVDQPLHHVLLVVDRELNRHPRRSRLAVRHPRRRSRALARQRFRLGGQLLGPRRRSPRQEQQKRPVSGERQQQSQHDAMESDGDHGEDLGHGWTAKPAQRATGNRGYLGKDGSCRWRRHNRKTESRRVSTFRDHAHPRQSPTGSGARPAPSVAAPPSLGRIPMNAKWRPWSPPRWEK